VALDSIWVLIYATYLVGARSARSRPAAEGVRT
jgi:hypothetical protein